MRPNSAETPQTENSPRPKAGGVPTNKQSLPRTRRKAAAKEAADVPSVLLAGDILHATSPQAWRGPCVTCGYDQVEALSQMIAERHQAWLEGRLDGFADGWKQGLEAGLVRGAA